MMVIAGLTHARHCWQFSTEEEVWNTLWTPLCACVLRQGGVKLGIFLLGFKKAGTAGADRHTFQLK